MAEMKYIIIGEDPFIFPTTFSHGDMAKLFKGREIVSAGFVKIVDQKYRNTEVSCYGYAATLMMEARPEEDSKIIERLLLMRL